MGNKALFRTSLQRVIGQIRYRPTLSSFNSVPKILEKIEKDFEEWQARKHDDVVLYCPSKKKFIQTTADFITYVNEESSDSTELVKLIKLLFEENTKVAAIKEVRRIGVRNTLILSCELKYQEIVDLFYRKFYSDDKKLKSISSDNPRDVLFVLDGIKNGFWNHVQIGPMKREEARKSFQASFDIDEKDIKGESYLFIDVDVFSSDNLSPQNASDKIDKAAKENQRIVDEYIKFVNP